MIIAQDIPDRARVANAQAGIPSPRRRGAARIDPGPPAAGGSRSPSAIGASAPPARLAVALALIALAALCALASPATATDAPVPEDLCLILEPSFMRHPTGIPLPGAQRTVLVPARLEGPDAAPVILDKPAVLRLGLPIDALLKMARRRATHHLQTLQPIFQRDRNKVIECAIFRSPNPLTATILLAPELPGILENTLGPNPRVIVPNRFTVYAFPSLADRLNLYAEKIVLEFRMSPHPISLEVFEIDPRGIRAVGNLVP